MTSNNSSIVLTPDKSSISDTPAIGEIILDNPLREKSKNVSPREFTQGAYIY